MSSVENFQITFFHFFVCSWNKPSLSQTLFYFSWCSHIQFPVFILILTNMICPIQIFYCLTSIKCSSMVMPNKKKINLPCNKFANWLHMANVFQFLWKVHRLVVSPPGFNCYEKFRLLLVFGVLIQTMCMMNVIGFFWYMLGLFPPGELSAVFYYWCHKRQNYLISVLYFLLIVFYYAFLFFVLSVTSFFMKAFLKKHFVFLRFQSGLQYRRLYVSRYVMDGYKVKDCLIFCAYSLIDVDGNQRIDWH